MARHLCILGAAVAAFAFLSAPCVAQPNSTTVDYIIVTPSYECVRISPGGIGPHSAGFAAYGFNRGPNAVAEDQGGDDIPLGEVPVTWAMPDAIFDAHSGEKALTESPDGNYGNNWDVTAQITQTFDLTGASSASVEFWHHYNLENNWDFGRVQINPGPGWSTIATYSGDLGSIGNFSFATINLSAYLGQTVQLRFRVQTDGSVTRDGWVVDDVVVRIDGTPTFSDDLESGLGNWTLSGTWGETVPGGLAQLGTISQEGKFVAGGVTGTTFVRAIYSDTIEAQATVDVYPPDWVP